jgi:hypothetical protein
VNIDRNLLGAILLLIAAGLFVSRHQVIFELFNGNAPLTFSNVAFAAAPVPFAILAILVVLRIYPKPNKI